MLVNVLRTAICYKWCILNFISFLSKENKNNRSSLLKLIGRRNKTFQYRLPVEWLSIWNRNAFCILANSVVIDRSICTEISARDEANAATHSTTTARVYREHINIVSRYVYDSKTRQLPQPCVLANYSRSASSQYTTSRAVINALKLEQHVYSRIIYLVYLLWIFQHQVRCILKTEGRLLTYIMLRCIQF